MNVKLSVPPGQEAHHPNQKAAQVKTTTHRNTIPARSASEWFLHIPTIQARSASEWFLHIPTIQARSASEWFSCIESCIAVILPYGRTTRWRVVLVLRDEAQARGSFSVLVFIHGNALILVT